MLALLLAACSEDSRTALRAEPFPGWNNASDTAEADTRGDSAGGASADTAGDTAGDTSGDTGEAESSGKYACYLGPARDYSVCLSVVNYDVVVFGAEYQYPDASEGGEAYAPPVRFLDLQDLATDLEIAPNFALGEYLYAWKGRWGVMQSHVVDRLQDIRDEIQEPLQVNSGYRSPAYNTGVGGASWSRHMYGDAADIQSGSYSVEELGVVCEALGADYVGLYEDGHTHCDWRYHAADPAFYDAAPARPVAEPRVGITQAGGVFTAPAEGFDEGEPFRRWTAYDAAGNVLVVASGREFVAPTDAASIEVRVGGGPTAVVGL